MTTDDLPRFPVVFKHFCKKIKPSYNGHKAEGAKLGIPNARYTIYREKCLMCLLTANSALTVRVGLY